MRYISLLLVVFSIKALALSSSYGSGFMNFQDKIKTWANVQPTQNREFASYDDIDSSRMSASYIPSVILSIIPGFGAGHLMQSRWLSRGWMFTVGEIASLYLAISPFYLHELGWIDAGDPALQIPLFIVSLGFRVIFLGIKVWEIYDVTTYKPSPPYGGHNRTKSIKKTLTSQSTSSSNQKFFLNVPVFHFSF